MISELKAKLGEDAGEYSLPGPLEILNGAKLASERYNNSILGPLTAEYCSLTSFEVKKSPLVIIFGGSFMTYVNWKKGGLDYRNFARGGICLARYEELGKVSDEVMVAVRKIASSFQKATFWERRK